MPDASQHRAALTRVLAGEPDVRWAYLFGAEWELEATRLALDIAPWLRRHDELREAAALARKP